MTRSALNRIIALALALPVVVALTLAGLVLWMAQTPMTDAVHDYRIGKGTGFQGLAEDLHSRSYISSPELLRVYRWWRRTGKPVQMGDYRISAGMLPGEFLDMIEQGRVVSYDFSIIRAVLSSRFWASCAPSAISATRYRMISAQQT